MAGAGWVAAGTLSTQALRMARMLALTWFLAPEQMGLWVLLTGVYGLLQEFSDTGVKHALVQNPRGRESEFLQAAWWLNVGRNAILVVLLFIGAPWIATIYKGEFDADSLTRLLQLSCLTLCFDGLTSISLVALRKELRFKKLMVAQVGANFVGMVVAILLGWRLRSAAALVWGEIAGTAVLCGLSYLIHPFRPRWCSTRQAVGALLSFGMVAYLVSLVDAAGGRLDVLILGKLAGSDGVAQYGLGLALVTVPVFFLSQISVNVGFAALSEVQADRQRLRRGVARMLAGGLYLATGIFAGLFLLADDVVRILPARYAQVGLALRWLSLSGLALAVLRQLTPVLYAIGQIHWCIWRGLLQLGLYAGLIGWFYSKWGLTGACWCHSAALGATVVLILIVVMRQLHWQPAELWRHTLRPFMICAIAGIIGGLLGWGVAHLCGWHWTTHVEMRLAVTIVALALYALTGLKTYRSLFGNPGHL